jgi:hypothetical protein
MADNWTCPEKNFGVHVWTQILLNVYDIRGLKLFLERRVYNLMPSRNHAHWKDNIIHYGIPKQHVFIRTCKTWCNFWNEHVRKEIQSVLIKAIEKNISEIIPNVDLSNKEINEKILQDIDKKYSKLRKGSKAKGHSLVKTTDFLIEHCLYANNLPLLTIIVPRFCGIKRFLANIPLTIDKKDVKMPYSIIILSWEDAFNSKKGEYYPRLGFLIAHTFNVCPKMLLEWDIQTEDKCTKIIRKDGKMIILPYHSMSSFEKWARKDNVWFLKKLFPLNLTFWNTGKVCSLLSVKEFSDILFKISETPTVPTLANIWKDLIETHQSVFWEFVIFSNLESQVVFDILKSHNFDDFRFENEVEFINKLITNSQILNSKYEHQEKLQVLFYSSQLVKKCDTTISAWCKSLAFQFKDFKKYLESFELQCEYFYHYSVRSWSCTSRSPITAYNNPWNSVEMLLKFWFHAETSRAKFWDYDDFFSAAIVPGLKLPIDESIKYWKFLRESLNMLQLQKYSPIIDDLTKYIEKFSFLSKLGMDSVIELNKRLF